ADSPETRGIVQSAYQILVASSPELLAKDTADVWDTGKIESNRTSQIEYAGPALQSSHSYWWKVRVWSATGFPSENEIKPEGSSEWSQPSRWEMGFLHPEDWSAKWIEASPPTELHDEYGPVPILRKDFTLPNKSVAKARLSVTALGLYEMHLN